MHLEKSKRTQKEHDTHFPHNSPAETLILKSSARLLRHSSMHATMDLSKSETERTDTMKRKRFVKELAGYLVHRDIADLSPYALADDVNARTEQSLNLVDAYEGGFITTDEALKELVKLYKIW